MCAIIRSRDLQQAAQHHHSMPQRRHISRHFDEWRMLPWVQHQLSRVSALNAPDLSLHSSHAIRAPSSSFPFRYPPRVQQSSQH